MSVAVQLALYPVASLSEIPLSQANGLLRGWSHDLGAIRRPSGAQAWMLAIDGEPAAVAVSACTVSRRAAGYPRESLVELGRIAAAGPWANRVMIRLWREVCAPRWPYWRPAAAVSYSTSKHLGELYRFDGWTLFATNAGSRGGGGWSTPRRRGDPLHGPKRLWVWRYEETAAALWDAAAPRRRRRRCGCSRAIGRTGSTAPSRVRVTSSPRGPDGCRRALSPNGTGSCRI